MYIRAYVTPDARRDRLEQSKDGTYAISVRAPARGNQANRRVLELIAQEFTVPITQVRFVSGQRGRGKIITIDN